MLLQLESLSKSYATNGRAISALSDVSLRIDSGQFCALRGKSGCGKSTLLLAAGGLLRPDQGRVEIDGHDLYAMSPNERAGFRATHIGFVFQQFHLVPYLSVLDNVLTATLGVTGKKAELPRQRAMELIEQFGLTSRIKHRPAQLSTGERQRAAMARAMLNRPRLLLADEPTGNLDDENSEIVLQHLDQFARDGGAVLLVTHDQRASKFASIQLQMTDGKLTNARDDS